MNDAEVDAMSQQYNRALDAQRKEIDSYRQSDVILREENARLRADLTKEHSDSLQHHHAWMAEMEFRKHAELQVGKMREALDKLLPNLTHHLTDHVYGPYDRLERLIDGCPKCEILKILWPHR